MCITGILCLTERFTSTKISHRKNLNKYGNRAISPKKMSAAAGMTRRVANS